MIRGKTVDNEFVAAFIQECTAQDKSSPEEICAEALRRIEEIDSQFKLRLKLTDVLSFFSYKKKARLLEPLPVVFTNINAALASEIIAIVSGDGCVDASDLIRNVSNSDSSRKEFIFTLKQLLETNVLYKNTNGTLAFGSNFKLFNESKPQ